MTRPGYGERHPDVIAFLVEREPDDSRPETWITTGLRLMASSYFTTAVPPALVGSARCIVWDSGRVIVCDTPDGPSITPGGRFEMGETSQETVCREVYEETGRSIEPTVLQYLGFVHYQHRDRMRVDYPYPYPDFFR